MLAALVGSVTAYNIGLQQAARLLDLSLPTTRPLVRAAYRRKAATTHPDVASEGSAFLQITSAYELCLQFGCARDSVANEARAPRASSAQGLDLNKAKLTEYRQKLLLLHEMRLELGRKHVQIDVMSRNVQRYNQEIDEALASGRFTTRVLLRNQVKERCVEMTSAAQVLEERCDSLNVEVRRLRDELLPGGTRRDASADDPVDLGLDNDQPVPAREPTLGETEAEHRRRKQQLVVMARNIDRYTRDIQSAATGDGTADGGEADDGRRVRLLLLHTQAKERFLEMKMAMRPVVCRRARLREVVRQRAGTAAERHAVATAPIAEAEHAQDPKAAAVGKAGAEIEAAAEKERSRRAEQAANDVEGHASSPRQQPQAPPPISDAPPSCPPSPATPPPSPPPHTRTLPAQVEMIKEALGLDMNLAIAPALREANKVMGVVPGEGATSLPSQAAAIIELLGV